MQLYHNIYIKTLWVIATIKIARHKHCICYFSSRACSGALISLESFPFQSTFSPHFQAMGALQKHAQELCWNFLKRFYFDCCNPFENFLLPFQDHQHCSLESLLRHHTSKQCVSCSPICAPDKLKPEPIFSFNMFSTLRAHVLRQQ